jgi:hypothetical protein
VLVGMFVEHVTLEVSLTLVPPTTLLGDASVLGGQPHCCCCIIDCRWQRVRA